MLENIILITQIRLRDFPIRPQNEKYILKEIPHILENIVEEQKIITSKNSFLSLLK